jgi:hypothetical protein
LRSFASRTGAVFRDVTIEAALHGYDQLSVLSGVIAVEVLPVPILVMIDDPWKLIHLEFLALLGNRNHQKSTA